MMRLRVMCLCLFLATSGTAGAVTLPYTETFSNGNANWGDATSSSTIYVPPVYLSTGGPDGAFDAYISTTKTFASSSNAQLVFRGQGNFDASGDAFVGDWTAAGANRLNFWIMHDASVPLRVGARFSVSANNPAFSIVSQTPVVPNVWTLVSVPLISADTPFYDYTQEGGTFAAVRSAIANVQIIAQRESLVEGSSVQFAVDNVQVVPEPASWLLAAVGMVGLAAWKARRPATRGAQARRL